MSRLDFVENDAEKKIKKLNEENIKLKEEVKIKDNAISSLQSMIASLNAQVASLANRISTLEAGVVSPNTWRPNTITPYTQPYNGDTYTWPNTNTYQWSSATLGSTTGIFTAQGSTTLGNCTLSNSTNYQPGKCSYTSHICNIEGTTLKLA